MATERVFRYDAPGRLGALQRTPTGGIRVQATPARAGLQTYHKADGSAQVEWRPTAEVSRDDSLASFAGAAVTIGHPSQPVTTQNWAALAAGQVSDRPAQVAPVAGSPYPWVHTELLLQRHDAITFAERGAELSVGYSCVLDPTPGTVPEGEPDAGQRYDAVQREIVANHVALLKEGCARAGGHARLRFDGSQEPLADPIETPPIPERQMPAIKIKLDDVEYESGSESHVSALNAAITRRDTRIAALDTAAGEGTKREATLQAKVDGLTKELAAAKTRLDSLDSLVEQRAAFVASVKPVLGKDYVFAGKSEAQIRRDCLTKLCPTVKLDGKDETYIAAYFEATMAAPLATKSPFHVDEADRKAVTKVLTEDDKDPQTLMAEKASAARLASYPQA